jgi:hypothetical protein
MRSALLPGPAPVEFFAAAGRSRGFSRRENPGDPARFTLDGSAELEAHLEAVCAKITGAVRGLCGDRLDALLLGGGYGRGEGGVLRTPHGDRPYNDLEFYVFLRGNRHLNEHRHGRALHVLGEILTKQAGVEVEFKIASLRELAAAPVSMFSYDLITRHRRLHGDPALLAPCAHHRAAESIPLAEATRLLMNRCSGLLFARERLEKKIFTPADADFVHRNIAKAELALGDAVLVAYRSYHWSARERDHLLRQVARCDPVPEIGAVGRHHALGVEFKFHPIRSTASREALQPRHDVVKDLAKTVWLWIESKRLGLAFTSPREYAELPLEKSPDTEPARNLLVNLKAFGGRPPLAASFRHPRNRILHALPLLLWEPSTLTSPELLKRLQSELRTHATTFPALMEAYRAIWQHVN